MKQHLPDQRQGQHNRNPETLDLAAISALFLRLLPLTGLTIDHLGRKTRLGHGSHHGRLVCRTGEPDPRPLGGQIDIGLHARLAVEHLLQTG